jgi:hypothetical protein
MRVFAYCLASLALLLSGCPTETGNPPLLFVDAISSDPGVIAIRGAGTGATVDEAWLSIGALGLVPGGLCPDPIGAIGAPPSPGIGDHSGPDVAVAMVDAEDGEYCASVAELEDAIEVPVGAPPELAGRAMVLLVRLEDGTPVRIVSSVRGSILVPATAGTFAVEEGSRAFFLGLDVAAWISVAELEGASREADGSIVLDDTRNTALRDAFDDRALSR